MKKLKGFWSRRFKSTTPSWKIVFEWEDIIANALNIRIKKESKITNSLIYPILSKFSLVQLYHKLVLPIGIYLRFDSIANPTIDARLNKNCIPVIIDFWLKDNDIDKFFKCYKNVPIVLITNKEVYDKLLEKNSPIPIEHWPLSFPDLHALTRNKLKNKKFDVCLFGRNNPFFIRLLDEYSKNHPQFTYLKRVKKDNKLVYIDNRGREILEDNGRTDYLTLIQETKVSCYSTPGIDESKLDSNGYNQVTPRVFEMLCNGCKVIGHYPLSSDVEWYKLYEIVPNVNTYDEFEKCLDEMLATPFDFEKTKRYVERHYTSTRIKMLTDILAKYNISSELPKIAN
jgi:hypothetical protein